MDELNIKQKISLTIKISTSSCCVNAHHDKHNQFTAKPACFDFLELRVDTRPLNTMAG